jgi:2-polyprenyl-3-methyl-5-hydroxy-6-metoxy-1,4-benzoquinol methylase
MRPRDYKVKGKLKDLQLGSGDASINIQVQFYDQFWNTWHERYRNFIGLVYHFDEKSRMNKIKQAINRYVTPGLKSKAFDLGCGRGRLARVLQKNGFATAGIDLSESTINEISKKFPQIEFIAGDMFSKNNLAWGEYDLVVSSEVMEHIQISQRESYVDIIHRLLKEKGIAVVTTPNMLEMSRLGWSAEQPLDFWMTPMELRGYFDRKFTVLELSTTSYCFKNIVLNRLWKLIPFVNNVVDRLIQESNRGKYQIIVLLKKSNT